MGSPWDIIARPHLSDEFYNKLYAIALQKRVRRLGFSELVSYTITDTQFSIGLKKITFWDRNFPFRYLTDEWNPQAADFEVLNPIRTIILDYYIDDLDIWIMKYMNTKDMYTKYINTGKWRCIQD